jgi:hypothetical protein
MDISQIFPSNSLLDILVPKEYKCKIIFDEDRIDLLSKIFNELLFLLSQKADRRSKISLKSLNDFKIDFSSPKIYRIEFFENVYLFCQPIEGFYIFVFSQIYEDLFSIIKQSDYADTIKEEIVYLKTRDNTFPHGRKLESLLDFT